MNEDTASEAGSVVEREQDKQPDTGRTYFTLYTFTSALIARETVLIYFDFFY